VVSYLYDYQLTILFASVIIPIHVTCPVDLILLDVSVLVIFGEEYYTVCNSLLHSFIQCTFTSSHLDLDLPLSVLFLNTFSLYYLMLCV